MDIDEEINDIIRKSPFYGLFPNDQLLQALDYASNTQATEAGKKVIEKYAEAIKNLGDK